MTYSRDDEETLTRKEMEDSINMYIEKTADELIFELKRRKKEGEIKSNEKLLCIS